ncbi:chloramphenicol phosphotransferase CPT [Solihabitans fulvus]|uniref:Chloramphenicol phosphotransferase CPT n=1 Tax=Solihabitans fulvus TaxID=1892852 RepID=A0A5B2XEN7_9PSEU|nr:chloramphenicol phosphotransferase CPT [Solihabitans fulvus]KAA2261421.1 chloramphenicol phosphotransferase CPT [Solihabitans fulvus]
MSIDVIVLNGASSSGKTGIARCLQSVLPGRWLTFGVDTLVRAMPVEPHAAGEGISIGSDGRVAVGDDFYEVEAAWGAGLAAMVRAGANLIIDEVFLGGARSQARWRAALAGLDVLWVGVHCAQDAAAGREIARGDRVPGMAASQASVVHVGVDYDLEIDTTRTESIDCARHIADHVLAALRQDTSSAPTT